LKRVAHSAQLDAEQGGVDKDRQCPPGCSLLHRPDKALRGSLKPGQNLPIYRRARWFANGARNRAFARIRCLEHTLGEIKMALIQWSSELSVRVEEIDKQHQKLISMINQLNDAMRQGKGKEVAGKIVDGLVSYTQVHFAAEEKYFSKFGYPETEKHVREHREFARKAAEFRNDFANGKLTLTTQIINFLSDWLKHHIRGTDQKYVPFMLQNGLK
jgi:hemerythrin